MRAHQHYYFIMIMLFFGPKTWDIEFLEKDLNRPSCNSDVPFCFNTCRKGGIKECTIFLELGICSRYTVKQLWYKFELFELNKEVTMPSGKKGDLNSFIKTKTSILTL